jgi:gamma-glutamylcyclotransferase (GGCT)/AIG2-like uncharacterized protein YtfP
MSGGPNTMPGMRLIGKAKMTGSLFHLGQYPGLVIDDLGAVVHGELYEVAPKTVSLLDLFERYDPSSLKDSLYLRCRMQLIDPPVTAWVYVYNQIIGDAPRILSGYWKS